MISSNFGSFDDDYKQQNGEEREDLLSRVIGCTPIRLEETHLAEMRSLVQRLPEDLRSSTSEEKNLERFQKLVELYGDEPQLLDQVLPELVHSLVLHVQWPAAEELGRLSPLTTAALLRLRTLSAVRGHKHLMRLLPHKLELLQPVLAALEHLAHQLQQPGSIGPCPSTASSSSLPGPSSSSCFQLASIDEQLLHILVLWLMIICKNPFNLARMVQQPEEGEGLTERIVHCLDTFLARMTTDMGLAVVPVLLAQLLTRNPDNRSALAPRFAHFHAVFEQFRSELEGGRELINQLALANALLKHGRRREIRPFAELLLGSLTENFLRSTCPNILVRNFVAKLEQRLALVLLRPKLAPWRYLCGFRSLEDNLNMRRKAEEEEHNKGEKFGEEDGQKEGKMKGPAGDDPKEAEEDGDVPYDEVERLLAELLLKCKDRDNLVRWTAAKGVARICERIPLKMAAEVVGHVLKDFEEGQKQTEASSNAWMGGCLTLAELCRRGCLLPEQVPKVISLVLSRALVFEQSQLGFMLAVNVRDAACYICWAFARAYEAQVLRPHLAPLAGTLVSLTLFDREVNVRRAASAAFQENVGRNDSFPSGIATLQLLDYAEVARIRHCYLELAVRVAQLGPVYVRAMLDHLCTLKSRHWDEAVRELAAEALQRLAPFDGEYSQEELLPKLCARVVHSKEPGERHGAFFAVSAMLEALAGDKQNVLPQCPPLLSAILEQSSSGLGSHRTKGFSLNGKSLCRLIQALCTVGCPLRDEQLSALHGVLDSVVSDANAQMAQQAQRAFPRLMAYYKGAERFPQLLRRIRLKYLPEIDGPAQDESQRCASTHPLGHLQAEFLAAPFPDDKNAGTAVDEPAGTTLGQMLVQKLIGVVFDQTTPKWVFARVAAIETLCALLSTAHDQPNCSNMLACWPRVFHCLCHASDDYTATTNGNIGRFARRAAILAMGRLLPMAFERAGEPGIGQQQLDMAIGKIVERACESIDDLREKASTVLAHLADMPSGHPLRGRIAELELLRRVFLLPAGTANSTSCQPARENDNPVDFHAIDWRQSKGFARLAALLDSPTYGRNALAGFVLSAGSICGWTKENAFLAIAGHLRPHKQDEQFLNGFLTQLLHIYEAICTRQGEPLPLLVLFRTLLNDGQLQRLERNPKSSPAFGQLCELVIRLVTGRTKTKVRLEAVAVCGSLLQVDVESELYRRVLRLLLSLLNSPYVALREKAVEQLFEAFSLVGGDEEEGGGQRVAEALELLEQTDWGIAGNTKAELGEIGTRIAQLLMPMPAMVEGK